MALHDCTQDSKISDKLFDRCDDENDDYMIILSSHHDTRLEDEEAAMNSLPDQIKLPMHYIQVNVI